MKYRSVILLCTSFVMIGCATTIDSFVPRDARVQRTLLVARLDAPYYILIHRLEQTENPGVYRLGERVTPLAGANVLVPGDHGYAFAGPVDPGKYVVMGIASYPLAVANDEFIYEKPSRGYIFTVPEGCDVLIVGAFAFRIDGAGLLGKFHFLRTGAEAGDIRGAIDRLNKISRYNGAAATWAAGGVKWVRLKE
ncbi:MAG: hypothetical protein AABZ39_16075 [Spirochaetota bacterium]